ncbi:hypothetical protein Syn7502_02669 [Synechococcus sp. PCC 7502]|uniref:hypothetical protein n=1 Tax=Synechococcus sp. PCC 7502 TaxID=1173263 RepID=UPI00029FEBCC|nr:hypothetical protein [Synechococcus sp. PCC 7502]AFY74627.1 hypothetical protein Syn7502_02669 [Synechococcus sp. PCC 7502]
MNTLKIKSHIYTSESDDNLYFVIAIFVDEEAIADFDSYATCLAQLKQSVTSAGTYFILTCSCGVFECAGIYQGIRVVHHAKTIEWIIHQPQPHRVFIFDADDYKEAVNYGIDQIK